MDREAFRKAGYAAIDRVCDYFENLESMEVISSATPGSTAALIAPEAPVEGEPWSAIEASFDSIILPGITHWQHGSFFAYFPANTTYESILADIYTGAVSNPGFNWACSPSCTELEVVMMDWVAKMLGLDPSFYNSSNVGGGILMGSASESCLTVCVAARSRVQRLNPDVLVSNLVIYGTTQTHSLGAKAALILGVEFRAIVTRAEDDWGLRGADLAAALEEDGKKGKVPFILLATMGSTSTGAIDNIAEITAVSATHPNLFIHLDAAWAGVYLAVPELRAELQLEAINTRARAANAAAGILGSGEVHSFCTNLHKAGLVTFDASCLWIRDRKLLTDALDITPTYLRNTQSDLGASIPLSSHPPLLIFDPPLPGTVTDYRNWQLPLGRRFRSLKLFFVLRSFGTSGFAQHLRRLNTLARQFECLILSHPEGGFALFTPRRLSLVVFRLTEAGEDKDRGDKLNREFFRRLSERRDVHLTATVVGGRYCVRLAVGSQNTTEEHVWRAWEVVKDVARETRVALKGDAGDGVVAN